MAAALHALRTHCGGPLHQANYLRKPRGGARAEAGEALRLRIITPIGMVTWFKLPRWI